MTSLNMRSQIVLLVLSATFLISLPLKAGLTISWIEPEKFSDFKTTAFDNHKDRAWLIQQFEELVHRISENHLQEGTNLKLTISDIDMAGRFTLSHETGLEEIRIVESRIPYAHLFISYRLTNDSGKVIRSGKIKSKNKELIQPGPVDRTTPFPYISRLLRNCMKEILPNP